jgi:hypothetical protein
MEQETEGPEVDDVLLQLLLAKAQKARGRRAESILSPAEQRTEAVEPSDEEMGELEQMLAEGKSGESEMPCETCGKGAAECQC